MEIYQKPDVLHCISFSELENKVNQALEQYIDVFPTNKDAKILLKPNLNSNMNALTGNTTDLRLLAVVIRFLKDSGYTNITIGEGTNSGFYRQGISVIARLSVDKLAYYFGVQCVDLNLSDPVTVPFENDVSAGIAKDCVEADFFINMPKLKTHFEAGMSVCLKNLIGCLVGQENKKKTHNSLAANIIHITEKIKPDLHIVDALIAMEGLGPTKGKPRKANRVIIGTNPYHIDLLAARYARFDYRKITTLAEAQRRGIINKDDIHFIEQLPIELSQSSFLPPKAGPLASFIHNPKRQKYFLAIRNTPFFNYLCNTKFGGKLLYLTDLRQDVFIEEEMELKKITLSSPLCTDCKRCREYCPVSIDLPAAIQKQALTNCISCLYCFCVCPENAIEFHGKLGFMAEQLNQYDAIIREIA